MCWRAIGLNPGDEVVFSSHTMVATAAAIHFAGGVPVPVDCGPDHLMDPEAVERAITPRTRGISPVHLNGRTCQMDKIMALADKYHLIVVEDAAQGLGSKFKGKLAGTFGLAAAFSFYPAKNLGCMGDGGAVITNDEKTAKKISLIRDHGRNDAGEVEMWGLNSRLDNLQAAILDLQFKDYQSIIERRREFARIYQKGLGDIPQLELPPDPDGDEDHFDVFQNYEIEVERRDDLRAFLNENGIGTIIQWGGKAVHQFQKLGFRVKLPALDKMLGHFLMLPMNVILINDEVEYIFPRSGNFTANRLSIPESWIQLN